MLKRNPYKFAELLIAAMDGFQSFLECKQIVPPKQVPFHVRWVRKFLAFSQVQPGKPATKEDTLRFLRHLARTCEDWQVRQAEEAIRLFYYHRAMQERPGPAEDQGPKAAWRHLSDEMKRGLLLRHRSRSTLKLYLYWLGLFERFLNGKLPAELTGEDIRDFMSHLAVERHVAASTQNQSLQRPCFLLPAHP